MKLKKLLIMILILSMTLGAPAAAFADEDVTTPNEEQTLTIDIENKNDDPGSPSVDDTEIRNFITRLYSIVLGRTPDESGLENWVAKLLSGEKTAAEAARGFFESSEFINKNYSDSYYIDTLYEAILDRSADSAGKANWQNVLDRGFSRRYLLVSFTSSEEFKQLCEAYNITQGKLTVTEARDKNGNITDFVCRFYNKVLDRNYDVAGLNNWCGQLISGGKTGANIADAFFNSSEFNARGLSNEDLIETLYVTLLGRISDDAGKGHWLDLLAAGVTKQHLIVQFTASKEFGNICAKYGIKKGSAIASEPRDKNGGVTAFVSRYYTKALGRAYDIKGLNNWCEALNSGSQTGADITFGFFFSKEFINKHLSDADFVETLYQTLFSRSGDAAGKAGWLKELANRHSREWVVRNFIASDEFVKLASSFGINAGYINRDKPRDKSNLQTQFVGKVYNKVLGRTASDNELDMWVGYFNDSNTVIKFIKEITTSRNSGILNGTTNYEICKTLYRAILFREGDAAGLASAVAILDRGGTVDQVIDSLYFSSEFESIAKRYDIPYKRNGWQQTSAGWRYFDNGKPCKGWEHIGDHRYYFDLSTGLRYTGWHYIDGYKFFFNEDGINIQDLTDIIGPQASYFVSVSTMRNVITVYAKDGSNGYIIPVKTFLCSTGTGNHTKHGTFTIRRLGRWVELMGPVWGQYVSVIYRDYLFHSTWYYRQGNNQTLSVYEHNRLGTQASHGCVRLHCGDAQWIYQNCNGSIVTVADYPDQPFDRPSLTPAVRLSGDYGYDPTDPAWN